MFPHTSHTLRGRRLAIIVALALSAAPALAQTAGPPDADWPEANRDLRGDRYSPLKEITPANVKRLRPVATFETGQECSFQTNPVVVDGTMYLTTYNHTYAIDAATGKLKWKNVMPLEATGTGAQRGVANLDGKVFRGAPDGQVYAFDAANGHELWHARIADPAIGESIPAAPIAWNGLVIIGNAGGDMYGVVGRIYGLDAETGKQVWRFDVIPKSGPAAATWHMQGPKVPPTGGTTWTTYALDPDTGVLYTGTGNPAPDFAIGLRPGENLYATCVVALDAKTGHLLAWVQPTPHDFHDWDVSAAPVLITSRGGLHLAATGGKDGFLHGIEVSRVERAASAGFGPVTASAATAKYGAAGRGAMVIRYNAPVTRHINTTAPLTTTRFTRFAPGSQGGVEWNGPAWLPDLNLVVVPAIDWATSVKLAPVSKLVQGKPGQPWSGSYDNGFGKMDSQKDWGGWITAVDADTGRVRWRYRSPTPQVAGVVATGSGLVFTGDINGDVYALDGATGRVLWRDHTHRPVGGGVISYEVGGRQYVAAAVGMTAAIWPTKPTTARIVIYRLP